MMYYSSVKIYCVIVLFAFVAVPCIECGVIAEKQDRVETLGDFPFFDGLRRSRSTRPSSAKEMINPNIAEDESNEPVGFDGKKPYGDHIPFIDGLRKLGSTRRPFKASEEAYPFIDGLRMRTKRPFTVDDESKKSAPGGNPISVPSSTTTSSHVANGAQNLSGDKLAINFLEKEGSKASNDDHYPFINGLILPTLRPWGEQEKFGANPSKFETGNGEFPFINGVLRRTRRPWREQEKFGANPSKFETGNGEFPFINGVLRRTRRPWGEQEKFGANPSKFETEKEEYPFINGLLWSTRRPGEQVGSGANPLTFVRGHAEYPFINGLRRRIPRPKQSNDFPFMNGRSTRQPRQADEHQESDVESNAVSDEQPSINGLLQTTTVGASVDDSKNLGLAKKPKNDLPFASGPRVVNASSPQNRRQCYNFGKRLDGDRKVFEKVIRKPIRFGRPEITFHAEYPRLNEENSCPINFITVHCTNSVCETESDKVEIIEGGVNETYFKVRITSYNTHLYKYQVTAFTKCT